MRDLVERLRDPVRRMFAGEEGARRIEVLEWLLGEKERLKLRIEALEGNQKDYLEPRIEALEKALAIFMQFEGRNEDYTLIDQALFREARAILKDTAP